MSDINLHLHVPTDMMYILRTILSWNYIFVRRPISTVIQSTVHRSYSLIIAYAMSSANNQV